MTETAPPPAGSFDLDVQEIASDAAADLGGVIARQALDLAQHRAINRKLQEQVRDLRAELAGKLNAAAGVDTGAHPLD